MIITERINLFIAELPEWQRRMLVRLRQLIHVGFKVAAKMGDRYLKLLQECESSVSRNVTTNLFERHIKPLFLA